MALGFDDVAVGTWTAPSGMTGCTVVLPPAGTLGAMAVRGAAPGTREAATLGLTHRRTEVHGVMLAGSSAYGLAAADGAVGWLEEQGIGFELPNGIVPIVGAAIILDEGVVDPVQRVGAEGGRAACIAATTDEPAEGGVGAGAGATVAKVGGIIHGVRSGQGIAVRREGALVVGALVVNNAVGEVVGDDGEVLVGTTAPAEASRYPADPDAMGRGMEKFEVEGPATNTVIGCVVTNADLHKAEANRLADLAHGGIGRAVRPAHTSMDGDALFALCTGTVEAGFDLVTELAVEAVAEATRRGPLERT